MSRYKTLLTHLETAWAEGYEKGKAGHERQPIDAFYYGKHTQASFYAGHAQGFNEFQALVKRIADNHTHSDPA